MSEHLWCCICGITVDDVHYTRTPVPNSHNIIIIVTCVVSGFRREVDENRALLGYCAAGRSNSLPAFWDILLGPIVCPETSIRNYLYLLRNNPEERSYHLA